MRSLEKKQTLIKDINSRISPSHISFPLGYFDRAAQVPACACGEWLRKDNEQRYKFVHGQ